MIQDNEWLFKNVKPLAYYYANDLPVPSVGYMPTAHYLALGPTGLNQSVNRLDTRYWLVSQEQGRIVIRGAE